MKLFLNDLWWDPYNEYDIKLKSKAANIYVGQIFPKLSINLKKWVIFLDLEYREKKWKTEGESLLTQFMEL